MKRAVAGVLGVLALAGCGGSGLEAEWPGPPGPSANGTVAVGPFNDYLAKYEDYASSPEALATEFLRLDEQTPAFTEISVTSTGERHDLVLVVLGGRPNQSFLALDYRLDVAQQKDGWRLISARFTQRCRPGRGHQGFSAAP